jgi:ribose-phosphate pyrophosphokinase
MITVFSDNNEVPVNKVEFSDGAITFKLEGLKPDAKYISINVDPATPVNLVREELLLIADCLTSLAIFEYFDSSLKVILNLPYLPYGRCDRVFETGNPNGLLSFLYTLSELTIFDEMHVCDIHNKSAVEQAACLRHLPVVEKDQLQCFKESLPYDFNTDYDYIIAPDKGAVEKAKTIAAHLEVGIEFANKVRDVSTGKLTEMNIPDCDFTGKKVLIPDDIADNSGTHVWLAELLKKAGASQVDLYITHAIFPKGMKHLTGIIDNVYCYQTVAGHINKQTVLDFNLGK